MNSFLNKEYIMIKQDEVAHADPEERPVPEDPEGDLKEVRSMMYLSRITCLASIPISYVIMVLSTALTQQKYLG